MRIKAGQHPLNGAFHELLVVNLVDIAGFHLAIHREEFVQILNLLRLLLLPLHVLRDQNGGRHRKRQCYGKG